MAFPQLDRLKQQLMTSGIQQRDNATWQVINQLIDILRASNIAILEVQDEISGGGSGTGGITELTGDVTAGPGSGSQVATIANDAVTTPKIADDAITTSKIINGAITYEKIQEITQTSVLLGNGDISAPATVQEIGLGENLEITDGILEIDIPEDEGGSGEPGLEHRLLSGLHFDTLPAEPILGDLIKADSGGDLPGTYANALIITNVVEDFIGIRGGYFLGYQGSELNAGNQGWGYPPELELIDFELPDTWLTWNLIDGFLQTNLVEDFDGIRVGYTGGVPGGFEYLANGNSGAYYASLLELVPMPDLANPTFGTIWQRLPVGTTGQIIQPIDGIPTWTDDLELAGSAQIDGDVTIDGDVDIQGDLDALNANMTVQGLTALGSIQAPQVEVGSTLEYQGQIIGVWTDVAFNAGDFTANGGTTPTWTLTSPDQVCFRYMYLSDEAMVVQLYVATTTVASVAGNVTELRVLIPDGRTPIGSPAHLVGAQENGAAVFDVYVTTDSSIGNFILIRTYPVGGGRAFDQTANASYFGFTITLKVS